MHEFYEIFGHCLGTNADLLIKHLLKIDDKVSEYYEQDKPFLKGDFGFRYYDYLKDRKLNYKPLSTDKVFDDISLLFQNVPVWNNSGTMLNIIPHVNIAALAVASYASLFNANFSQDRYAGLLLTAELEVVKYISELVGWDWEKSHGLFTFGGKATNLYATKIAINRACTDNKNDGINGGKFFLITSKKGHPCHKEVANWLGIGCKNCIEVNCDANGEINLEEAYEIICQHIEQGYSFLGFNLTGGSTVEFEVDPIKKIAFLRDKIINKYKLNYSPLIHVDSVIVWVWLFFLKYDFVNNPIKIEEEVLKKIKYLTKRISEIQYADSFGLDFHKSGFCPAVSSLFIVKDRTDIYNLGETKALELKDLSFGNFSPFESSLELSRSSWGPISALVSLKSFGIEGFQKAIAHLLECAEYFKNELKKINCVEIINPHSNGLATLLIFKPKEYEALSLSEILSLPFDDTEKIKKYNINYALYVNELNKQHKISFTLTASDAFNVRNTNVCLGSQKAYPMSLFITKDKINHIINEMIKIKNTYDKGYCNIDFKQPDIKPIDMVYRS